MERDPDAGRKTCHLDRSEYKEEFDQITDWLKDENILEKFYQACGNIIYKYCAETYVERDEKGEDDSFDRYILEVAAKNKCVDITLALRDAINILYEPVMDTIYRLNKLVEKKLSTEEKTNFETFISFFTPLFKFSIIYCRLMRLRACRTIFLSSSEITLLFLNALTN